MARILLADDDPILRATAGDHLLRAGHTVTEACDGAEALDALERGTFDLLIVDMLMPNTDGLEVILQLRRSDRTLPVLAISSGGRMDVSSLLRPAAAFGATATMSKPLLREPFLERVETLLAPKRRVGPCDGAATSETPPISGALDARHRVEPGLRNDGSTDEPD